MREWVGIYLKGFCMGAADIVPGVSGGTIALITGIYDRLVDAIAAIDPRILGHLPTVHEPDSRRSLWNALRAMDLPFLLVLAAGMATAVLLVSRVILHAFDAYPAALNAFFFGLIGASAIVIYRDVSLETPRQVVVAIAGFLIAFTVSGMAGTGAGGSLPIVFLAGAIAISAMILPGISGAAFLYILGQYEYLLGQLSAFVDAVIGLTGGESIGTVVESGIVVATFMTGAVIGLLTMARIVSWALAHYRIATLAFLVSLMVGALRMPVEAILVVTSRPTGLELGGIVLAAVVGAAAVLVLDWYTDSLDYV